MLARQLNTLIPVSWNKEHFFIAENKEVWISNETSETKDPLHESLLRQRRCWEVNFWKKNWKKKSVSLERNCTRQTEQCRQKCTKQLREILLQMQLSLDRK